MGPILAGLRKSISEAASFPVIVATNSSARALAFARAANVREVSQQGPATPDHILRTKRLPLLGRDVQAYAEAYREYFSRNAASAKESKTMLDPAPRVVLDDELGMCCVGRSAKEAAIAHDLYSHTIEVISRAQALGGYRALSERELFEFEYWDLEQAKLRRAGQPPLFAGEIAVVTGAAAYAASKAALTQLARIAALEWGGAGIRVNVLHPNAVFDTALWTEEVLKARAESYGLSVEEYKRNNGLKTEVRSKDVGELAAELCGPTFAKTTGAQIPIDGGNDRVI